MLSKPSRARLRARTLRAQIAAAALLSAIAVISIWASAHHRQLPSAKLQHHASQPGLVLGVLWGSLGMGLPIAATIAATTKRYRSP
jgi:hypothetical protein